MQNEIDTAPPIDDGIEPIAIVGLAARLPGAADVGEFWRNLVDGVESHEDARPQLDLTSPHPFFLLAQAGHQAGGVVLENRDDQIGRHLADDLVLHGQELGFGSFQCD